ncbi:MAG: 50S ribosomal protein L6 [Gammaproteobacteria bacterium]|nr:MAG: 50S ribosomal protein L6 [Gammaproteobacteria bacterium]
MARIENNPLEVPTGVDISINGQLVTVKGNKGQMELSIHPTVSLSREDNLVKIGRVGDEESWAMAGTTRALLNNMVTGVSQGFEKKLELVGVGYRAQTQGKTLNLTLGFSHPINYEVPEGITIETPSQTEIVVRGIDKQVVGQVAANIRAFRPPEPYKGKGVKYADEHIIRKEAKKK